MGVYTHAMQFRCERVLRHFFADAIWAMQNVWHKSHRTDITCDVHRIAVRFLCKSNIRCFQRTSVNPGYSGMLVCVEKQKKQIYLVCREDIYVLVPGPAHLLWPLWGVPTIPAVGFYLFYTMSTAIGGSGTLTGLGAGGHKTPRWIGIELELGDLAMWISKTYENAGTGKLHLYWKYNFWVDWSFKHFLCLIDASFSFLYGWNLTNSLLTIHASVTKSHI